MGSDTLILLMLRADFRALSKGNVAREACFGHRIKMLGGLLAFVAESYAVGELLGEILAIESTMRFAAGLGAAPPR